MRPRARTRPSDAATILAVRLTRLTSSPALLTCVVHFCSCGRCRYGRCHAEVSGFEHPWYSFDPTHYNIYESGLGFLTAFRMAESSYRIEQSSAGKRQWNMRMGFGRGLEPFMMLPSDMALVFDPVYKAAIHYYDANRVAFRRDAAAAFRKLTELGCEGAQLQPELSE